MAATLFFGAFGQVQAQSDTPPPVVSRGENFSAKPAPALFNADCTGAGCHKGPQGLGKGQSQSSLAGFLREHYTNSRESAGALAAYILKFPAGPPPADPRAARASNPRQGGERSTAEAAEPAKPAPTARNQRGRQPPTAAGVPPPAEPAPPPPQFDIFD
jgi:hypothetical protein